MQNRYQHRRHNKNLLMVHRIFVAKYRKPILYGQIKEDTKQHIFNAYVKHHWYIYTMETDGDHTHILLQYNPSDSITKIVGVLKSYSTYHIWRAHNTFRSIYDSRHFLSISLKSNETLRTISEAARKALRYPLNSNRLLSSSEIKKRHIFLSYSLEMICLGR